MNIRSDGSERAGYTTLMSSDDSETAVCGSFFDDLDDWEVITGCHQNRTSFPQLIETLAVVVEYNKTLGGGGEAVVQCTCSTEH